MQNRNFTFQTNNYINSAIKVVWGFMFLLLGMSSLTAQCPDGQTNVDVVMGTESFPGDNGWVLWDATLGTEILCQDTWANGATLSTCLINDNSIELYVYDSFGDGWSANITVTTAEDGSAYTNGCAPNQGNVLLNSSYVGGPDIINCGSDPSVTGSLLGSFTTTCIMCELACPADITVSAEPGLCGANVNIPLPTVSGVCNPNPIDMSGFYPVGTTEVIFDADANGVGGGVACSMFVTVTDDEMPTVNAPADVTISLGGGKCGKVYNYLVTANDACGNLPVSITQSIDPVSVNNSFACPGGSNSYYRVYNLQAEGIFTDVALTSVEIGVFEAFNLPAVTVKIYELTGPLNVNNLELIAQNTLNIANTFIDLVTFPILADLKADKTYVVEVVTPGTVFNGFVMGTNDAGQTAPSYMRSLFCGIPNITNLSALSTNQNLVINLAGTQESVNIEQISGLAPGSEFPIGVTTNEFIVTDVSGNTSSIAFDVNVLEYANPINTLACNNLVNVSLNTDCEGIITADMVLEGGPYGCYDNYTVTIKDSDGNVYGDMITGDMVNLELIVEIQDLEGNICWGDIKIEDKVGPMLECGTRTTQCTESTLPGASLASTMRFTIEPNTALTVSNPVTLDIPFEINGLDNASISDVNLEIEIGHTWVSDLGVVLVSPEGTEVTMFIQPGTFCSENNLHITLDDEAALTAVDLANVCTTNDPSIEGDFQPVNPLSAFDGEDPNGTWIIRVNDFAAGDGGIVRSATLEISQIGGIVGLPIPDGATFTPFGNQSFFVFGLDPCSPSILTYEDVVQNKDCTSPFTKVIYRTYTATDESGNESVSCTDTINVLRTDLGSLQLPRNYNDLDLPSLSCSAGYPTPAVTGSPTGAFCDNVQMDYTDITIDICEGSYKILRYWSIFEWCNSEIVEYTQIIKVSDKQGPSIQCPVIGNISTSPSDCVGSLLLPTPIINDNCTAVPSYTVSTSSGDLIQQGQNYSLINLPVGLHSVTYTAFDNCGNSSSCSFNVNVGDDISPVAVCDKHTTVSLSFDEYVTVDAETFDDGSYDECSDITWSARRMTDACGISGNTSYGSSVTFCCADVGNTIMVEFRVEDANGNYNTCMVEVFVQDKIAPAIQVPPNVTLSCQDDYTDLNLTGGLALGFDNCDIDPVTYKDFPSIGTCGSGQVSRVFTVKDKSGLTASGTQIIFLVDNDPFDINDITFPQDVVLTSCTASTDPSSTGEPILNDDICSQVAYTYWDDVFVIVEGSCEIIYRKWTVIDQCQYNSSTNQNIGIWEDIQVIEITNNTAPEFTTVCNNITIDGYGPCEEQITLSVDATDDCTPANKLTYTWKIDAFNQNDGIYEFENTGKTLTGTFPFGTHRIIWTVSDNCGNINTCSYLFTIKDAKAPTPYCISTLSTAVMNTNGQVTIWASDFSLGATDNCSLPENISVSFTEFGITPSRTFGCADIPNGIATLIEDIQVWYTDEAGNKDYCTVSLVLEDNGANFCDDLSTIVVSGELTTPKNEMINDVEVKALNGLSNDAFTFMAENGNYSFDLIPDFNYEVTASKNIDVLNGVTTLDIVLIQKHILGIQTFDSPYKSIAADTDNNGKVSGADIIAIRKLILGFKEEFPNGQQSWRFVDKKSNFIDNFNVFPYDEIVNLDFISGPMIGNDFYGIKIGDINQSADPANFTSNIDARSNESLEFVIDNQVLDKGITYEIPVYATNFENILAYQMTLEFDTEKVAVKGLKSGVLEITEADYNMAFAQKGMISALWGNAESVSSEEALFYLVVEAKENSNLVNIFRTSDRITETLSYSKDYSEKDINIVVREADEVILTEKTFVLYQNAPNPFSDRTLISFDLPKTDVVQIQVYNMNGQLVHSVQQVLNAGYNIYELGKEELGISGVYYYTVTTTTGSASSKMILLD